MAVHPMEPENETLDRNAGGSTRYAYEQLRAAILEGDLPGDTVLSQVKLAAQFGVSRTPLREAIRLLQREGLVESEPNRRVRVASLSVDDLEQLFASRILLESFGIATTVPRLSDADIVELEASLAALSRALNDHDHEAFRPAHARFRQGLFALAGARLEAELSELYAHGERYRQMYLRAADEHLALYRVTQRDYEAVLDAVRARDAAAAAALIARHLSQSALTVIAHVRPDYEPALIRSSLAFALRGLEAP